MRPRTDNLSITEILNLYIDLGPLTVNVLLEEKIKQKTEEAEKNGYEKARQELSARFDRWQAISENVLIAFGVCVGLTVLGGIYLLGHNINARHAELDAMELKACADGDYEGCIAGWNRNIDSENPDVRRAAVYEQTYFHSKGQILIQNPDSRYFQAPAPNR